ncbi:hypothetical protein ACJX0J_030487, partial [Zea mays]
AYEIGCNPNSVTYCSLIDGLGKKGNEGRWTQNLQRDESIFHAMKQRGFALDARAYNAVVKHIDRLDEAYMLFEEAKSKGIELNVIVLFDIRRDDEEGLMDALVKAEEINEALICFQAIEAYHDVGLIEIANTGQITLWAIDFSPDIEEELGRLDVSSSFILGIELLLHHFFGSPCYSSENLWHIINGEEIQVDDYCTQKENLLLRIYRHDKKTANVSSRLLFVLTLRIIWNTYLLVLSLLGVPKNS